MKNSMIGVVNKDSLHSELSVSISLKVTFHQWLFPRKSDPGYLLVLFLTLETISILKVNPTNEIMTMNCPNCGTLMVWLNGSITHDRPVKHYQCRICNITVIRQPDGFYQIFQGKDK
jgi:hypothetical protein